MKQIKSNLVIKKARAIAADCLRRCYDANGIVAGRHQFNDYWARDSFFASFGALEIKNYY